MIAEFLASWSLFQTTWLTGWLIALVLSLVGVLVVARDQIFIGAAVAQASVLGVAVALRAGGWAAAAGCAWCDAAAVHTLAGGAFAVLGALVTAVPRGPGGESREAMTGWVFLGASAVAVLLLAHSPHGMEEVNSLLASTIIGATMLDLVVFAALAVASMLVLACWRTSWLLLVIDAETAAASGLPVAAMSRALTVWIGVAVGLAIHVAGVVFTFGYLVLPALVAKNVCREMASMLWVSPVVALASATAAFVLAHGYDFPPAQMAVALLAGITALAWAVRSLRERTTAD